MRNVLGFLFEMLVKESATRLLTEVFLCFQIIRVQSPEGMKKITSTKRETAAAFLKKVRRKQTPMRRRRTRGPPLYFRSPFYLKCSVFKNHFE